MEERWWPTKSSDLQYSRYRISSNLEESSHQASLMARDLTLGPSVAPCLVETSTAHGEFLLWATVFSTGKIKSPPDLHSRRSHKRSWPSEAKLGFHSMGLVSESGPLTFLKPKNICCGPSSNFNRPRYNPKLVLSIFSLWLCRYPLLNGRRHQLSCLSPSMLWIYNYHLRTLLLVSSMAMINESKSLKLHGRLISIPLCRRSDFCYQRSLPNIYNPTTLSTDFKYRPTTNTLNTLKFLRLGSFPEASPCIWRSTSLPAIIFRNYTLKHLETDCIQQPQLGIVNSLFLLQPSRSMVNYSRKNFRLLFRTPLLPVTEKNRTRSSSASQCIKPAIREAKYPSSTSQDLLIVTISKVPEPFVEVSSTHRVLACGMLLVSLCFRVYMNLSLKFIAYPIFLMYVWKTLLQNFVSVASPLG